MKINGINYQRVNYPTDVFLAGYYYAAHLLLTTEDGVIIFKGKTKVYSKYGWCRAEDVINNTTYFSTAEARDVYYKPLANFTTEDGVDMFEGQEYCYLTTSGNIYRARSSKSDTPFNASIKRFSTREIAQEYFNNKESLPVFVTEDGVDIFKGDQYSYVDESGCVYQDTATRLDSSCSESIKRFSTGEKAQEYLNNEEYTPLFTTEDGVDIFGHDKYIAIYQDGSMCTIKLDGILFPYDTSIKKFYNEELAKAYSKEYLESLRTLPLFRTEDEVDIYEGDIYQRITQGGGINGATAHKVNGPYSPHTKRFSTKKLAQEYLESLKPLFTTEDGVDIFEGEEYTAILLSGLSYSAIACKLDDPSDTSIKRFSNKEKGLGILKYLKPKPLFTTDDGVDVFEGQEYCFIWNNGFLYKRTAELKDVPYDPAIKRFSTREKAQEYLEEIKPTPLYKTGQQ